MCLPSGPKPISAPTEVHPKANGYFAPTLLAIPLEIRRSIYLHVLEIGPSYDEHYTAITLVNHQIRNETLPVFWSFKDPKCIRSLEELFEFVAKGPLDQIQMVKGLSMTFDIEDLEKIAEMTPLNEKTLNIVTGLPAKVLSMESRLSGKDWMSRYRELCKQYLPNQKVEYRWPSRFFYPFEDAETLKQAEANQLEKQMSTAPPIVELLSYSLLALSNVQEVDMNTTSNTRSMRNGGYPKWTPEVHLLLEMLAKTMPNIQNLSFGQLSQTSLLPLTILPSFRNIRTLKMEVYTESTPTTALESLLSLRFLENLTLTVNGVGVYRDNKLRVNARINADVIAGLRPLKCLTIEDGTDDVPSTSPDFKWLSTEIVQAIAATHSQSLKEFNVYSNWMTGITNPAVFDKVLAILPTMGNLEKVGLCFRVPEGYRTNVGYSLAEFMPAGVKENRCRIEWEDEVLTGYYSKLYYGS